MATRNSALANAIAPLVAERLEDVIAQAYAQPLGSVDAAGRAGYQDLIRGDDPAAGADFLYRVGGDAIAYPLSVMCRLTCSAVVSERSLTVEYRDADGVRWLVAGAPVTLEASQSQAFCWQPQAGDVAWPVNDTAIAPLPQQFLYPGTSLAIHLEGGDALDQIDRVRLSAYLYPTG